MPSFMDEMPLTSEGLSLETDMTQNVAIGVDESKDPSDDKREHSNLVAYILEEFNRSKIQRMPDEHRWLECFRNYRGIHGPSTQFTSTEKSKAFIKITKTKVLAATAKVSEVLFAGNKFPIGIEAARIPVGVDEAVHFDVKPGPSEVEPKSSQVEPHIAKLFGPKKGTLDKIKDKLKSGTGTTPTAITYYPAIDAARKLEKLMHDQLDEANATKALRNFIFEFTLFGTGGFKGPLLTEKEYPRWDEDGTYNPIKRNIPFVESPSIWDLYPDADARNMSEVEKFIQRHRLSKTELRALKKRPMFRGANIEALILEGPSYNDEYWEHVLRQDNQNTTQERYEVLEFWGVVDAEMAKEHKIKIPKEFKSQDQIQVNAWISRSGHLLRLVFNPFVPARIPYHLAPYEVNPYSIFGVGVAENMIDTQILMNGFMRLAVDNAALSSNVIFEVNEDMMAPGQTMELFPGKIFRRQGGQMGQAINANKIDNVTNETLMLFDKARQLADEATGMPSYSHGMTGVQGVGRTASGMSMLMGAAAENIKAVVRNLDDYLLSPLGRDLFAFNMQFNFDKDFVGDLAVVAKGTESLMRNEVRSQKLLQLAQFAAANPAIAPMVRWDYILRETVVSMDLEEDKVVNDPREAAVQAALMAQFQNVMAPPQGGPSSSPQPQGGAPAVPNPSDPTGTGGGNVAPGAAPEPGAAGFSDPTGGQPQ